MRDLLLDDENAILSPVVVPPCRNRNRIHIAPPFPKAVVGGTKSRNVEHPTFNCLKEPVCWLYVCARASHWPPILFTMLHFNDWCNSSFLNDIMGYQIASLICFFSLSLSVKSTVTITVTGSAGVSNPCSPHYSPTGPFSRLPWPVVGHS